MNERNKIKSEIPDTRVPKIELTMLFGSHQDKENARTILEQLNDKDVLLFEGTLGWRPGDEQAWNDITQGRRADTEKILESMHFEPRAFGKELLEGLAHSRKRVKFCDLQLADALKTLLSSQREMNDVQRRIIPAFLEGAFADALFCMKKYCTIFAYMNEVREAVMAQNIKEEIAAMQNADKDTVRVLAFFGAVHTPLHHTLKDELSVPSTMKLTVPVHIFSIQEEIFRLLRSGKEVSEEKYKQAIYEYTLAYLLARAGATQDPKKLNRVSALLARRINGEQYKKIAQALKAHGESPETIFNTTLEKEGLALPVNENDVDILLKNEHTA